MNDKYINAAGKYLCEVKCPGNGWIDKTKGGTAFIRIPLVVINPCEQTGKEIVYKGWLTDKSIEITTRQLVSALEWDGEISTASLSRFENRQCRITVEAEEYGGEIRYKIRWINSPEECERPARLSNALSEQEINEIAASLGSRTLDVARTALLKAEEGQDSGEAVAEARIRPLKVSKSAPVAQPKPRDADDDIPF